MFSPITRLVGCFYGASEKVHFGIFNDLIRSINKINFIVPVLRNWPFVNVMRGKSHHSFHLIRKLLIFFFAPNFPFSRFFFHSFALSFAQWTFASLLFAPQCDQEHFCKSSSQRLVATPASIHFFDSHTFPSFRPLPYNRSTSHCFRKLSTCFYILSTEFSVARKKQQKEKREREREKERKKITSNRR